MWLEDDVLIPDGGRYARLACLASRYFNGTLLHTYRGGGSETPLIARFMSFGEAYLTSLDSARRLLRAYCANGIRNNFDMEWDHAPGTLLVPARSEALNALRLMRPGGQGYISLTGHAFNETALRLESAAWPEPAWCHTDDAWDSLPTATHVSSKGAVPEEELVASAAEASPARSTPPEPSGLGSARRREPRWWASSLVQHSSR